MPLSRPGSVAHAMIEVETSSPERKAILAGMRAGDVALQRAQGGVLELFVWAEQSKAADPRLDVLRAYAELRRALRSQGHAVPTTSLSMMGFPASQITEFEAMIAAAWTDS
jgi:hypothetical protein